MNIDALRKAYSYEPDNGIVTRLSTGKPIGCLNSRGYLIAMVLGKLVGVHRIAFALHNGFWPDQPIDHINWDKVDNRASNLRMVTRSENLLNSRITPRRGVRVERSGRFTARVRGQHVGTFDTLSQAQAAYIRERKKVSE